MDNRGVLAVISGFSGAGKGTLMRALLERYDNYALSISATTRAPREGRTLSVSFSLFIMCGVQPPPFL